MRITGFPSAYSLRLILAAYFRQVIALPFTLNGAYPVQYFCLCYEAFGHQKVRFWFLIFEITLGEFFTTPEFDALKQEIK